LNERDQSVSLERQDEMGERRALQSGRKEKLLVVGRPVDYQGATERKRKRCAESGIFQSGGGNDGEGRQIVVSQHARFSNGCRKQNVVVESKQSLREALEERGIRSNQNYFGHFGYPLLDRLVKKSN
jgi:hypothetical protein